jgi:hypothetical protein
MRIVTDEGLFLSGPPIEIVARLGALTRVGGGRSVQGDRESLLIQLECERIGCYQTQIGSQFAEFAASRLLESLDEEGLILIQR